MSSIAVVSKSRLFFTLLIHRYSNCVSRGEEGQDVRDRLIEERNAFRIEFNIPPSHIHRLSINPIIYHQPNESNSHDTPVRLLLFVYHSSLQYYA